MENLSRANAYHTTLVDFYVTYTPIQWFPIGVNKALLLNIGEAASETSLTCVVVKYPHNIPTVLKQIW